MKALKYNLSGWLYLAFFIALYFENWKMPIFSSFLLTSKLQLLFILVTLLVCLGKKKSLINKKTDHIGILSAFFIYFFLINFLSALIFGGEAVNMALLSNFLTLLCLLKVFSSQRSLIHTTAIVNIVMMDVICLFAINGIGIDINTEFTLGEDRLRIFGLNPNGLSLYAALSAASCIYLFFKTTSKINKLLLLASIMCCAELIIMCGSKGGLVYLFICMVVMLGDRVRQSRKAKILFLPLAILFIYFLFSYILSSEVFVSRFAEEDISDGRFALFSRGIKVFNESPIFGVGMAGYDYYMNFYFGQVRPTHNGYLDVAAYTGLIGLTFLSLYILKQGKEIIMVRKFNKGNVLLVLFLLFILNFAKDGGVVFSKFTWIHVTIMVSYVQYLKKIISSKDVLNL